jgi:hypothetical protein
MNKKLLGFLLLTIIAQLSKAQGCSDAGFCTIHAVKPSKDTAQSVNIIKFGTSYGVAQYQVTVISPYIDYTRHWGKISVNAKLLMGLRSGELSKTFGLADVILTSSWRATAHMQLIGGLKIPFNQANQKYQNLPLPMAYQTSLGTTDAIIGMTYKFKRWALSTAWQQPLTQNSNTFIVDNYPAELIKDPYLSTNEYKRSGDILVRVTHFSKINRKLNLSSSILPIFHLNNDSFRDSNGNRHTINHSRGLTLNLNTFIQYHLSQTSSLELSLGGPVKARDQRPDGLSQFSIGLEYAIRF